MNTKEMLLANNDLRDWWSGVANDGRFNQVLLYAQGIALEIIPSAEQRIGVMAMKEILLTIHEPEAFAKLCQLKRPTRINPASLLVS